MEREKGNGKQPLSLNRREKKGTQQRHKCNNSHITEIPEREEKRGQKIYLKK